MVDDVRGKGKLRPEQEEIRQLREEVKRLKMEKEILKKAAVFFAKETSVDGAKNPLINGAGK